MNIIKNDEEMNIYKIKKLEDNSIIRIIAKDFNDLQQDLIETNLEPLEIILEGECYITNSILHNK